MKEFVPQGPSVSVIHRCEKCKAENTWPNSPGASFPCHHCGLMHTISKHNSAISRSDYASHRHVQSAKKYASTATSTTVTSTVAKTPKVIPKLADQPKFEHNSSSENDSGTVRSDHVSSAAKIAFWYVFVFELVKIFVRVTMYSNAGLSLDIGKLIATELIAGTGLFVVFFFVIWFYRMLVHR